MEAVNQTRWIMKMTLAGIVQKASISSNLNDRVVHQVYLITYSKADLQKFPRWKFFQFNVQIEQNDQKEIPKCARCFASLVLN